jgi:succinoglycan biosynthesis protein ExoW
MRPPWVVIPFYQKRPGILPRAVSSALVQEGIDDVRIIVVDNLSPVAASVDLAELVAAHPGRIHIMTCSRRGPGAARNTALDSLPSDVEYVAFLDSDDEWRPDHLRHAVDALSHGFDFYFSDFYHLGQSVSAFQRAGRLDPAQHRRLRANAAYYEYVGSMFNQILTGNVIGTSTVVFRRAPCREIRFEEEYSRAGEDYLFWLEVCARTSKFVFSSSVECQYGEGVNVYSGSGWGTEGSLERTYCELKYLKVIAHRYHLTGILAEHNRRHIRRLRRYFVADILHRLLHRRSIHPHVVLRQVGQDVWTGILFGPLVLAILWSALRTRWAGGGAVTR